MFPLLQKLTAKPSDKNIRIIRIVFALLLIFVITLGWNRTAMEFSLPDYSKYILFVFPLIGFVRGIFDPGVFRKKIWKWTLVGLAVTMILISFFFLRDTDSLQNAVQTSITVSGELDVNSLINTPKPQKSFSVSTDFWFAFLGWILLIDGLLLAGKNITTKNERYGEKVTKIRV